MNTGLTGRIALVCGATSGLGLAIARGLSAEGARVAIVGRRAELVASIEAELPGALGIVADLTAEADRERIVATVRDRLGEVDILVANGGGPARSTAAAFEASGVDVATRLLVTPFVDLVQAVLPGMRERGWGRIVAVGSSAIQQPIDGLVGSNMARSAFAAYLKTLAGEVGADGVTVNLVLPGRIATARTEELDAAKATAEGYELEVVRAASAASIPIGRYGTPEEFAAVVTFVASAPASYITGEQIRVDGGLVRAH